MTLDTDSGRPLIEVCVDSVESAMAAELGGADRVELCDNLLEGGTTPSAGAVAATRERLGIKVHVMIRPRGGDFCYSEVEFDVMKRDIVYAKELGADGVVFGILRPDGDVDTIRTRELVELARPMPVTFHRAFDVSRDAFQALEDLASIGIDRILTSGQEATAVEGLETISELVRLAGDRITIIACGSLSERNIRRVVAESGVGEVHVTGFMEVESPMRHRNERVFMGGTLRPPEYSVSVTNADKIAALRSILGR